MDTNKLAKDRKYYLAFSCFQKIGPTGFSHLENYFPDLHSAFQANYNDLLRAGLKTKLITEFIAWRKSFCLDQILEELKKERINFITWKEENYPQYLKEISNPPFVLYFKGSLGDSAARRLAVVGSRNHSSYGEKIVQSLVPHLTKNEIEIVSGLALGIDALAHQAAIEAGGRTLAVLASGLKDNDIYPYQNRALAKDIVKSGGALISEYPPGTPAYKQNFPLRNRLIAGLSQATLVVEAGQKSGSLITARYALEENREVLAVPGSIFSYFSIGTNWLVKSGAKTITEASDILEIFKISTEPLMSPQAATKINTFLGKTEAEKIIYAILKNVHDKSERITADEINKKTKLDMATINSTLSILEIEGLAENNGYSYDLK